MFLFCFGILAYLRCINYSDLKKWEFLVHIWARVLMGNCFVLSMAHIIYNHQSKKKTTTRKTPEDYTNQMEEEIEVMGITTLTNWS